MEMDIAALLPILHLPLHLPWSALLLAHSARAASSFAAALAAATWKGMLLAMLVALCLRLLPQITAPARSIVWTTVFALIVLLHFAPLPSAGAAHAGVAVDQRWSLGIAGLWVLLSLHRAVQLGAGAARLGRLARRATPVDCGRACAHLLARTSRKVQVCTTEAVDRPSLAGFFSPRILLPPSLLAALSAAELEQILLHETEHLRRRDDWTNLLQKLALVLFPLNPVLLWVEHRLCLERELACDEGVLRVTRAGKAYASCLARLAEHSMVRHGISLALGAWERQPELSRRVHRILHRPQSTLGAGRLRLLTTLLVMGLVACAAGLTRSPELLRFSASPGAEQAESASMSNMQTAGAPIRPLQVPRDVAGPARLVQASLQVARPRSRSHITAAHLRRRPTPALTQRPAPLEPWVLLTGWRQAPGMARPALALRTDFSYAAVPFGDGWLIFQL